MTNVYVKRITAARAAATGPSATAEMRYAARVPATRARQQAGTCQRSRPGARACQAPAEDAGAAALQLAGLLNPVHAATDNGECSAARVQARSSRSAL